MTDPAQIRAYYDEYSTWYDAERRTGYYSLINDLEFEKIEGQATGSDVLEVGCGPGLILERTAAVAERAVGVDLSGGMVRETRAKGLEAAEAPATDLPFEDDSFDVVYSFKVLAHVPDIDKAIDEVRRVLRPEGVAYLEFYNPYSLKFLTNRLREIVRRRREVFIRYDTLSDVRRYTEGRFRIASVRGVRIFAPAKQAYTWPVVRRVFRRLERTFCERRPFSRLGGYLIVELHPLP